MSLCHHFDTGRCRSCTLIETPYEMQLKQKEETLKAQLALFEPYRFEPSFPSEPTGFRNKAKMVASPGKKGLVLGFGGMELIDCALYHKAIQEALEVIQRWLRELSIRAYDLQSRKGELKFVLLTRATVDGALMLRFVLRSHGVIPRLKKGLDALYEKLPALRCVSVNIQPEHKAVIEGDEEIILGSEDHLREVLGGITLHIRPKSFFQTNPGVAAALYQHAAAWVDEVDPKSVWDLFCGVGGFALHCADGKRKVLGVELEPEAIASAKAAAQEMQLENIDFKALDINAFSSEADEAPQCLIVNPPRRGLGNALCTWIETVLPEQVIYSSCNSETLVKDIERLKHYRPERVRLFDMFAHTGHFETLVLLRRQ
jgi:23S rRNA (uracil747-C5)-methyltransferase